MKKSLMILSISVLSSMTYASEIKGIVSTKTYDSHDINSGLTILMLPDIYGMIPANQKGKVDSPTTIKIKVKIDHVDRGCLLHTINEKSNDNIVAWKDIHDNIYESNSAYLKKQDDFIPNYPMSVFALTCYGAMSVPEISAKVTVSGEFELNHVRYIFEDHELSTYAKRPYN